MQRVNCVPHAWPVCGEPAVVYAISPDQEARMIPKSLGVGMGEYAVISSWTRLYELVGSGGAADCVIIAAYRKSNQRLFVIHAHRKTDLAAVRGLIATYVAVDKTNPTFIHLGSQVFTSKNCADSGLVKAVMSMLAELPGGIIIETYPYTSLAVKAKDGSVLSPLDASELGGPQTQPTDLPTPAKIFVAPEVEVSGRGKGAKEAPPGF